MAFCSATKIYFSPTGTTKKIIDAIAEGMGLDQNETIDLTLPRVRSATIPSINGDVVLIGVPVYETRIPEIILSFLTNLRGNGKPVVLIAVYGNMNEGVALNELFSIANDTGFKAIAAGSFIGEHSFSTEGTPIAKDRPDNKDLKIAKEFGKKIILKIQNIKSLHDISLNIPQGNIPFMAKILPKNSAKMFVKIPVVDQSKCDSCGLCIKLCPMGAINKDTLEIDEKLCLRCFCCVKRCPREARKIMYQPKLIVSKILSVKSKIKKQPKLYL